MPVLLAELGVCVILDRLGLLGNIICILFLVELAVPQ